MTIDGLTVCFAVFCRDAAAIKLVEIVADKGRQLVLRFSNDTAQQLPVYVDIDAAVDRLKQAAGCGETFFFTLTY